MKEANENQLVEQVFAFDGKFLKLGDTYLYKMNNWNKDAESNFDNFISILDGKEGKERSPIRLYLYKLAGICNQYGMQKDRAYELILAKFRLHRDVHEEFPEASDFHKQIRLNLEDIYGRYESVHNSWHKPDDDGAEAETPVLPEKVYTELPPILSNLTPYFTTGRERDVFLLSALGVLSSCFPEVQGNYDNNMVGMNLFLFISAPASAGKGVMIWARRLGEELHKDLEGKYRQAVSDYDELMNQYRETLKNGEEAALPVKPERKLFFIPANSSASKLIQSLKANGNFGVMLDTEADTLSQALGNDWGNFSDTLRKAYHHEPIELQRKLNDEYVSIEKSFLSVVLSGTPDQIKNLLASIENGFFSRFIFYDFPLSLTWKNVFDRTKEAPDGAFHSMAVQLLQYSNKVKERAAENDGKLLFRLSPSQEELFTKWFSSKQEQLHHVYGDQIIASLRRLGLITFRIAMILTVLRFVKQVIPSELCCSDVDFGTALSLTNTLLSHTTKVYNQLRKQQVSKTANGRKGLFLEKLPETFQRAVAMEIATLLNIKEKTAENYIAGFIEGGMLERVEHNHYQKV